MTLDGNLAVRLPAGSLVRVNGDDARRLVSALWDASITRGAVVAIGKIEHRIASPSLVDLELSELEANAIAVALVNADDLSPALASLRQAAQPQDRG